MGLIFEVIKAIVSSEEENNNKHEKKSNDNIYGLEDWQNDLVKKGECDPWNFEEEELEEDDFYYDD